MVHTPFFGPHSTGEEPPEGVRHAHLHRFDNCHWEGTYLVGVWRLVGRQDLYSLF